MTPNRRLCPWKRIAMSDTELLKRYAAGDEGAFQELVSQYKDSVYAFLRRFLDRPDLVDDVFQETVIQLYLSHDKFDLSRPVRPWLFTIAANKARDALRCSTQRMDSAHLGSIFDSDEHTIDDVLNTLAFDERTPCDDLIRNEMAAAVRQVIARMPARYREVLILAYFQKCSYAEIATIMGAPIGAIKSRLHTAMRRFADNWNGATMC
jgi:RNA polymerase sigma-70 factor (ECF subfamily)